MLIISNELYRYNHVKLNNIERIKITPQNKVQLILGTNGSGKSSLIREMSPLPANHKDYERGGYKHIKIQQGSSEYELRSDFSVEPYTYSFIKDGVELNPGHKLTDYRKLVAQEFNITQEIHDLRVGRLRFTQMSSSERRYWLTKFSDSDFTYALQFFKKLSEAYRDIQGSRKLQQARLVQEKEKLVTPEVEAILRQEIDQLTSLSESLLEMRGQPTEVKGSVSEYLSAIDLELERTTQFFRTIHRKYRSMTRIYTEEELDEQIIATSAVIHSHQDTIAKMCEELDKLQKTLDQISSSGVEPTKNVDATIQEYTDEIATRRSHLVTGLDFEDPHLAIQALNTVSETFYSLLNSLKADPDSTITRTSYLAKIQDQQVLADQIKVLEHRCDLLIRQRKELEHIKSHNELECPQCNHKWVKGYSESVYQQTLEQINTHVKQLEDSQAKLKTLELATEEEHQYLKTLSAISQLFTAWPILKPYWGYLVEKQLIRTSPNKTLQTLTDLTGDLEELVKIKEISDKLCKAIELKEMMIKDHMSSIQSLIDTYESKQLELSIFQKKTHQHHIWLDTLNSYKATFKNSKEICSKLESLVHQRDNRVSISLQELNRMYYTEVIQAVQIEISKRQHTISSVDIQKALIRDIEQQVAELDKSAEVLKIAVKELSPSEGLIAKGLTGFINHFVHQMNAFIKQVWLHPFEITPIEYDANDGVDLDYRFSMKVGDNTNPVPDIKDGSEAQRKMIDLAFSVVGSKYLHLDKAPLFLDEFAASMDHAHRATAFNLVTTLANSANFSNIFMISHFENSYSSLVNADVTVLCPHNIIIPKNMVYNQHTLIE